MTANKNVLWLCIAVGFLAECQSLSDLGVLNKNVTDDDYDSSKESENKKEKDFDEMLRQALAKSSLDDDEERSFSGLEAQFVEAYRRASPSVAKIYAFKTSRYVGAGSVTVSTGSGFLWEDGEHIVTAYHVLADMKPRMEWFQQPKEQWPILRFFFRKSGKLSPSLQVKVDLFGVQDRMFTATVVGGDEGNDIAVLKLVPDNNHGDNLQVLIDGEDVLGAAKNESSVQMPDPIVRGRSKNLREGQSVLTIGSSGGRTGILKAGIISELGGRTTTQNGLIVIDGFAAAGFSGGPLLDSEAKLIGMTIGVFGDAKEHTLAVPIDTISRVVKQIIEHGEAFSPSIGISGVWGLAPSMKYSHGLHIGRIIPDSPAADAGLQGFKIQDGARGDIIIGIDGRLVPWSSEFLCILSGKAEGDVVNLIVSRSEGIVVIPVTVTLEDHLDRKRFDEGEMTKREWRKYKSTFDRYEIYDL